MDRYYMVQRTIGGADNLTIWWQGKLNYVFTSVDSCENFAFYKFYEAAIQKLIFDQNQPFNVIVSLNASSVLMI